MSIELLDPTAEPSWDAWMRLFPEATFFHGSAWARTLRSAYGYRATYVLLKDGASPRGLLPLMEVTSALTGRRGVGLPFTDECAPLARDEGDFARMRTAACELAQAGRWRYVEYRGGRRWLPDAPAHDRFFGHELDLTQGESRLFEQCTSAVRRAVRKAQASGIRVDFRRDKDALKAYYRLHCRTRRRHGVPPQPYSFFASIEQQILNQGLGVVALAFDGSAPAAGAVFFESEGRALYKYGASDERFQHVRPANLVMWRAIQRFSGEGSRSLDFGRTDPANAGLRSFKLSWGARERTCEYFRETASPRSFVPASPPRSSSWSQRICRSLPGPILRAAGALLYKHVA